MYSVLYCTGVHGIELSLDARCDCPSKHLSA